MALSSDYVFSWSNTLLDLVNYLKPLKKETQRDDQGNSETVIIIHEVEHEVGHEEHAVGGRNEQQLSLQLSFRRREDLFLKASVWFN